MMFIDILITCFLHFNLKTKKIIFIDLIREGYNHLQRETVVLLDN